VARGGGDKKPISTTASTVMVVVIGLAMAYLGIALLRFGAYALGEGETLVGLAALVIGLLFVAGPVAVAFGQVRAVLRGRRDGS